MGYSHILWIRNDGIRNSKNEGTDTKKYETEIGKATLKLCLDPDWRSEPEGLKRNTSRNILNYGACINYVDEVHSSDTRIYVWIENRMCALYELDDDGFECVKHLMEEESKKRCKAKVQW